VYQSPNLQGSIYVADTGEADIFDGLTVNFTNAWSVQQVNDATTGWKGINAYTVNIGPKTCRCWILLSSI